MVAKRGRFKRPATSPPVSGPEAAGGDASDMASDAARHAASKQPTSPPTELAATPTGSPAEEAGRQEPSLRAAWHQAAHLARSHPTVAVAAAFVLFKIIVLFSSWLLLQRPDEFLRTMSTQWDGIHYLRVAREGYDPAGTGGVTENHHWPPVFPLMIRALGAHEMAGFWINNVASVGAIALVTRLMGWRPGLFLAMWPSWVAFSSFGYTEGTWILLAAAAMLAWRAGLAVWAGAAAATAILLRFAGVFPFLTFGFWALSIDRRRALLFAAPVATAGAGLITWYAATTGNPFAYAEASKPWGPTLGWPWQQIEWIYHGRFTTAPGIREHLSFWLLRNAAFVVPTVFGFALLVRQARAGHGDTMRFRSPAEMVPNPGMLAAFCGGTLVLVLFAADTQILGIPRYVLAAFPAIAMLGTRIRDPWGWGAYAAAAWIGACWVTVGHIDGFVS